MSYRVEGARDLRAELGGERDSSLQRACDMSIGPAPVKCGINDLRNS
jgi:hypothetical protein